MRALITLALVALSIPAGAAGECALRMIEPRLEDIADAARILPPSTFERALGAQDARTQELAVVAFWYAARASGDTEVRTRATAALFDVWDRSRPAGRLMRVVAAGLGAEGWPVPDTTAIERRLARQGDRDAVLARAGAVAAAPEVSDALLREALRGVTVMTVRHDPEALALAGRLLARVGEDQAVAETLLYRAELGDPEALRQLASAYRDLEGEACTERAGLVELLFPGA